MVESASVSNSLFIASAGLCCAVGYHLDAAVCAIRANMDHFQESSFNSLSSGPVNVASLPDDVFGEERLCRWIEYAVRDVAQRMDEPESLLDPGRTVVIVLSADPARPHANSMDHTAMLRDVLGVLREEARQVPADAAGTAHDISLSVIAQGRTGLTDALLKAANILANHHAEQVLLVGVDSYLYAADINAYLGDQRLFVRGNSNGFIPGEAAAAVLLRRALPSEPGVHIAGVGSAHESGRHDGSVPSRGQGLTTAIRNALKQARMTPKDLEFRISDQNGEQFYANDAASAITRVMFGEQKLKHLTLADKLGEVGAAAGPAMLAWLSRDMTDPALSPGKMGLVHLANDDGTRCAVTLRYQGEE